MKHKDRDSKEPMRFGLIGAGGIGQIRAKALRKADGSALAGVADVDLKRAKALALSKIPIFGDYRELLESADIDAVVVSTPPQYHEEAVIAALESGKHVLCEKPLSNSVDACRRMVAVSQRTGKVLTTGFNQRYFPAVQFVKETLDSGAIGELDHIRAYAGHNGLSEFKAPWEYDKSVIGGGALMDVGIHMIDMTRYLLGEVSEVFGVATGNVWNFNGSEDNGFALMRNPEGKVATLHASWSEWKGYRFHIEAYGDKGMVRARYAPMMSNIIQMKYPGGPAKRRWNVYPSLNLQEKVRGWQWTVERTFVREFADFVALCAGTPGIIADGFSGLRAVEIANAIYSSTKDSQSVQLAGAV